MMDNRQFNVKGRGKHMLKATIELLLMSEYDGRINTVKGWKFDIEKGFVLYSYGGNAFPVDMDSEAITNVVWAWLNSDAGKDFKIQEGQDSNLDHDGSNHLGFRVYNESWAKINGEWGTIGAVIPAWCWYGK